MNTECYLLFLSLGGKTLGYEEGSRRSACSAFGAGHHAAKGAGAGGGGLTAGFTGKKRRLIDIGH